MLLAPDHRVALQILESPRRLDLLITDIVMLGHVNGFALASMTAYEVETEEAVARCFESSYRWSAWLSRWRWCSPEDDTSG